MARWNCSGSSPSRFDVDAALPRLSAIVSKMLPHDALRMVCLD